MPQKPTDPQQVAKLPAEPEAKVPQYVPAQYGVMDPTAQHVQMSPMQQQTPVQQQMPPVQPQGVGVQQPMGVQPPVGYQQPMGVPMQQQPMGYQQPMGVPMQQQPMGGPTVVAPTIVTPQAAPAAPIIINNAVPGQPVAPVTIVEVEQCWNGYWLIFIIGWIFPIIWLCGSAGICSPLQTEKNAGYANAIAFGIIILIIIIAVAAG